MCFYHTLEHDNWARDLLFNKQNKSCFTLCEWGKKCLSVVRHENTIPKDKLTKKRDSFTRDGGRWRVRSLLVLVRDTHTELSEDLSQYILLDLYLL